MIAMISHVYQSNVLTEVHVIWYVYDSMILIQFSIGYSRGLTGISIGFSIGCYGLGGFGPSRST